MEYLLNKFEKKFLSEIKILLQQSTEEVETLKHQLKLVLQTQ